MGLIGEDPGYADAYDVLGRAQVEMGHFAEAIETYRTASELTPDSVVRLQKLGMMCYYMGERATAVQVLSRAVVLGIDSKLFDYQSLVLLAFALLRRKGRKGHRPLQDLAVSWTDMATASASSVLRRSWARCRPSTRIRWPGPCNWSAAWLRRSGTAPSTGGRLQPGQSAVGVGQHLHRFARRPRVDRSSSSSACAIRVRAACASCWPVPAAAARLMRTRSAIACNAGTGWPKKPWRSTWLAPPAQAIDSLLQSTRKHLNTKLIDLAQQLLLRHQTHLPDAPALQEQINDLRTLRGSAPARALLGQDSERQPGGAALRATANVSGLTALSALHSRQHRQAWQPKAGLRHWKANSRRRPHPTRAAISNPHARAG